MPMPPKKTTKISRGDKREHEANDGKARGSKELQEPLENWEQTNPLPTPQSLIENKSESEKSAITQSDSELSGSEILEHEHDAKTVLGTAIKEEDLDVENESDVITGGNYHHFSLASLPGHIHELEQEIAQQESEVTSLKHGITSLKKEYLLNRSNIIDVKEQVTPLTTSVPAYRLLRNQFISTFKRDKQHKATEQDLRIIADQEGKSFAHGGDAIVDAKLYQGMQARNDHATFKQLYGFLPQVVLSIKTINLLNGHAEIIASNQKMGSKKFYEWFAKFVELFEESGFNEDYLHGDPTAVTNAYWSFLRCYRDEVTLV